MSVAKTARFNILGSGLIRPLQRIAGSDFVNATGESLIRSSIMQILGTKPGEIPWRPDFGTDFDQYRHQVGTGALAQEIADTAAEAIARWEPRVKVSRILAQVQDNIVYLKIGWAVISAATEGNNVIIGPVTQEVSV